MAFKKRSGGGNRPKYSIAVSVAVRKGKYVKGPSFGLWTADSGPTARGSVKEDYLQELIDFLSKAAKRDQSVSFALFENDKKKSRKDEDDDDEDEEDEKDEVGEEEEEDDKPAKKKTAGKKKEWDFDDDED